MITLLQGLFFLGLAAAVAHLVSLVLARFEKKTEFKPSISEEEMAVRKMAKAAEKQEVVTEKSQKEMEIKRERRLKKLEEDMKRYRIPTGHRLGEGEEEMDENEGQVDGETKGASGPLKAAEARAAASPPAATTPKPEAPKSTLRKRHNWEGSSASMELPRPGRVPGTESSHVTASIREEQDIAYMRSLARDQAKEKERLRREEEQRAHREKQEEEEARMRQAEQDKLDKQREALESVGEEPSASETNTVLIAIRLPSNARLERRFRLKDKFKAVINFVWGHGYAPESHVLCQAAPRVTLDDGNTTLAQLFPAARKIALHCQERL